MCESRGVEVSSGIGMNMAELYLDNEKNKSNLMSVSVANRVLVGHILVFFSQVLPHNPK